MKICKNCEYCQKGVFETAHGPQMTYLCTNDECCDPVDGTAIPAHIARKEQVFCGIQAKYFKLKEVKDPGPVIQIK